MLTRESSVLRDGRRLTIPAESLVVGDVVPDRSRRPHSRRPQTVARDKPQNRRGRA